MLLRPRKAAGRVADGAELALTSAASWLVRLMFVVLFIVAGVLGTVGLQMVRISLPPADQPSWLDVFYGTFQLYTLKIPDWVPPHGPYPPSLDIARVAAPVSTASGAFLAGTLLLASAVRRIRARLAKDHSVVCGDGRDAIVLARRLDGAGALAVLVNVQAANESVASSLTARVIPLAGDFRDPVVLRRAGVPRAAEVFAFSQDPLENTNIALTVRRLSKGRSRPVQCYAAIDDPRLSITLLARSMAATNPQAFRLHIFDPSVIQAQILTKAALPWLAAMSRTSLTVVGTCHVSIAVVEAAARCWAEVRPRKGERLAVTVIGPNAMLALRNSAHSAGLLELCDVLPIDAAPDVDGRLIFDSTIPAADEERLVFVCVDDDKDALKIGLSLVEISTERPVRVIVFLRHTTGLTDAFDSADNRLFDNALGSLRVVSAVEDAADPDLIRVSSAMERLAQSLHEFYRQQRLKEGTAGSNDSVQEWADLKPLFKESSRAHAFNIGTNLFDMGYVVVPVHAGVNNHVEFVRDEVEQLSRNEHERWVAERKRAGFQWGPERTARTHPDMIAWENLSRHARQKDMELIRQLPTLVGNEGFVIARLPPT